MEWLWLALEAARHGHGGVRMLVGEAGIGKTHVAREFAERAAAAEAGVLRGACLEDDWRPAYARWIEALDPYVTASEPQSLVQHPVPLQRVLPAVVQHPVTLQRVLPAVVQHAVTL